MTDNQLVKSFRLNERFVTLAIHVMVVVMMVCLGYVIMLSAQRFIPGWRLGFLPWITMVISIESMVTWRTTRRSTDFQVEPLVFRGIELVVILIGIKLLLYLWQPAGQIWRDITSWQEDFIPNFFNGEYVFIILVTFWIWLLTGSYARDVTDLEGDEAILDGKALEGYRSDRGAVRRHIAGRVLSIGFIVALCVALANFNTSLPGLKPVSSQRGLWVVIIYFIMGFGLLSQTHFANLRASWAWERVSISPELAKRWTISSLIFLVIITLVAFALPTGYTLGIQTTAAYLLEAVVSAITFVAIVLFSIFAIPITLLLNLISKMLGGSPIRAPGPLPIPPLHPPSADGATSVPWWDLLKSVFFWGVFMVVVVFAFYQYVRQNQALLAKIRRLPFWTWMVQSWHRLWQKAIGFHKQIGTMVTAGFKRLRPERLTQSIKSSERFVSLRQLSYREKVLFYYLALARRSRERGFGRQPSQTPIEYRQVLEAKIPEARYDLQAITQEFMEARYSLHDITDKDAGMVKEAWERIRRSILKIPKENN